jgi:hypothetical protein
VSPTGGDTRRTVNRWHIIVGAIALTVGCSDGPASIAAAVAERGENAARARLLREEALASARVWLPPVVPIPEADLGANPNGPGHIDEDSVIECRFSIRPVSGTTPKFYCELPNGEALKIKYGGTNPELYAEVAASRLLTALGFMADHMFVVRAVRCAGCPMFPFPALRCYSRVGLHSACFAGGVDYTRSVEFDVAVLERKLPGRVIEAEPDQGWAWFELDRIDPARGGSPRAEVDAFRLMAVFLAHWDNKSPNQRLICPEGADRPDGSCGRPLAIMQDVGATFGPLKIDLQNWRRGRIWKDGATCAVSMEQMPWGGGTFPEWRISEAGRRMLLGLLDQLTDAQLRDLFTASRVITHDQFSSESRRADSWVRVFKDRIEQIRAAGPCPS